MAKLIVPPWAYKILKAEMDPQEFKRIIDPRPTVDLPKKQRP